MSSINAAATTTTGTGGSSSSRSRRRETYWCHECDMSVSLFSSPPLICPHCRSDFIEQMESPLSHFSNPNPNNLSRFPPPLDPFPILSPPQTLTPSTYEDIFTDDDDNFQIPSALRIAAAADDDYFLDSPYFDRLMQHLADPEDDTPRYHHSASTPASKSSVESIPTIKITSSFLADDTLLCAVCKDEFVIDVEAKQLPCKHIYHFDCILPWLLQHNSCPVCRFCLPTDEAERRPTRGGRDVVRFDHLMEDGDFFGIGSTLRHIARRRHRLVFPARSTAAQAETSSAGPANNGETLGIRGGVVRSARVDEDGDTVMHEVRESFFD